MTQLKKLSVLVVLSIFLISLMPVVLAEPSEKIKYFGEAVEKVANTFEKAKEKVEEAGPAGETKPLEETVEKAANTFEKAKEKVEEAKEQYQKARKKYQEAKQNYLQVKERVNELREEIKKCLELEGECEPKEKQFREQSKNVLINLADVILETLNKLKEKIKLSEMTEEEKEQLLADLEAKLTKVEEAKAILEGFSDDLTKEELKEAVKVIKEAWGTTKPEIKRGLGNVVGAKLGNIVIKIEQLEEKFNKIRDRLEKKGFDTAPLDEYLDEFNKKLALAKENWELAMEKFKEAKTAEDVGAAVKEAHQYQAKSRELIKEVKEDIRNIIKEIKELQALEEAEEAEEEEEKETEEETEETEEE